MQQPSAATKTTTTHCVVVVLHFTYVEAQPGDQDWLLFTITTIVIVYITTPIRTITIVTTYFVHVHQSYQAAPGATTIKNAATTNGYQTTT